MKTINHVIKRIFDLIFSFLGILFLSPVFVILIFLIKLTSRGPIFFIQKRIGYQGLTFSCIKFRTMYVDAEKFGSITTSADTRIIPIGKYLRKFKLDELPQLYNVLIGKMSFVGPRPDVEGYADKLEGEERKILTLRPGITGPASIYFRNEEELLAQANNPKEYNDMVIWPKKVELNLHYLENWCFAKDIGYILITIIPLLDKVFHLIEEPK